MDRQFQDQRTVDTGFYDVIVVGSGPAGLAAVTAAAEEGASCALIEREERPGGVLKQCIHDGFGVLRYGDRLTGPEYACREVATVRKSAARVILQAFVHSIERTESGFGLVTVTPEDSVMRLGCGSLVMATGCRERTDRQVLLHGDRPAGIFTAGQAQRLINVNGVMPGKRAVILGSGDIGMILARRLTLEGAEVIGMYETRREPSGLPRNLAQCLEDWDIPLHLSTTVTAVHGRDRVNAVTVCPVGADGTPDRFRGARIPCDTLILSVGLIPENDLVVDMGMVLDPRTHGPVVTQDRQTAVPGLYVCGNALHVYDLVDFVSECGRIAGVAAAAGGSGGRGRSAGVAGDAGPRGDAGRAHSAGVAVNAGSRGGAFAAAGRDPGRHGARSVATYTAGEIQHVVPQMLDPDGDAPVLFFRVARRMERARLEISVNGAPVVSKTLTYLSPPEMERVAVHDSAWKQLLTALIARQSETATVSGVEIRLIDESRRQDRRP